MRLVTLLLWLRFLFACSGLLAARSDSLLVFFCSLRPSVALPFRCLHHGKAFLFGACDLTLLHLFLLFLGAVSRKWGVNHLPRFC